MNNVTQEILLLLSNLLPSVLKYSTNKKYNPAVDKKNIILRRVSLQILLLLNLYKIYTSQ